MKTYRPSRFLLITLSVFTLSLFSLFYRGDTASTESNSSVPLMAPITVTKATPTLTTDVNGNGAVNAGDTLTYSVTVSNGATDATGVIFTDVLNSNLTLVPSSINSSPIAKNESYNVLGNVQINVPAASGVKTNDTDPDGTIPAITGFGNSLANANATAAGGNGTSAQGGNVTLNADGSFSYNPPAGYEGADSFFYTLRDAGADGVANNADDATNTAQVTLNVSGMIWFINNNNGACSSNCDGRLSNPFTTLAAFQAINNGTGNNPAINDHIFIYESGTAYLGGITLLNQQKLIGQDTTNSLMSITGISPPQFSSALPATNTGNAATVTIQNSNAAGSGITLNNTGAAGVNTIRGFTASNSTVASILGNNFGTVLIDEIIINTNGQALSLTNGTIGGTGISSVNSTGGASNISLTTINGTLALGGGAISGATGAAFFVSGGNVALTYSGNISKINATAGALVSIASHTTGNITLSGLLDCSSACTGIAVSSTTSGTIEFSNATKNLNTGANAAVNLTNNTGATINFTNGGLNIDTTSGAGFTATGGGTITVTTGTNANTIDSTSGGTAVNIVGTSAANRMPINIQLMRVSSNGGANGIVLTNTSSTGSPGGFNLLGNSAGNCGGIANPGTPGQTPAPTGTLPVTADCTGGQIQNTIGTTGTNSGIGILLTDVEKVSLTRVRVNNHGNFGVKGTRVNGFVLNSSYFHNNGDDVGGDGEGNVYFYELTGGSGANSITNSYLDLGAARNLHVLNTFGTLDRLIVSGTTIGNDGFSGSDGIFLQADNSANTGNALTLKATIQNGRFNGSRGDGIQLSARGTSVTDLVFTGNRMTNNHPNQVSGSIGVTISAGGSAGSFNPTCTYNVSNNTINNQSANFSAGNAIAIGKGGISNDASFVGTISGNVIGTAGVDRSGGLGGIVVDILGGGVHNSTITNNIIRQYGNNGILVQPANKATGGGTGTMIVDVRGNTVTQPSSTALLGAFNGLRFNIGVSSGPDLVANSSDDDDHKVCLTIGGLNAADKNTTTGSGTGGAADIRILQRFMTTVSLPGYVGGAKDNAAVDAFVAARNNPATVSATSNSAAASPGYNGTCTAPLAIASPVDQKENIASSNSINDLSFLNSTYSPPSEILASIQPFVKHSSRTDIIQGAEIVAAPSIEANIASTPEINGATYLDSIAVFFSEVADKFSSAISPTVTAQESSAKPALNNAKDTAAAAPEAGETVCVDGNTDPNNCTGGFSIPANESTTITFRAVINLGSTATSIPNTASAAGVNSNTVTTTVVQPPSVAKDFVAAFINVNGTTSLNFTVTNPNPSTQLTGVSVTDVLPTGLSVVSATTSVCGGTNNLVVTAATRTIQLTNGTINGGGNCQFSITVTGMAEGQQVNLTGNVTSTNGGQGNTATDTVTVINPPTLAKNFTPNQIQLNATSNLQFTLANPNTTLALNTLAFTDSLPAGMTAPNTAATTVCTDGSYSITANVISFTKPSLVAGTNCVFSVTVTGTSAGVLTNTTSTVTTANTNAGTAATASLTVIAPPTIGKAFSPTSIASGGTSTVTLTLTNTNATPLTNASFSDTLSNMTAVGGAAAGTCTGAAGNVLNAGAPVVNFTGITIPASGNCTVTFGVTSTTAGSHPNTTSGVTTNQTPVAGTVSNTVNLTVIGAPTIAKSFTPSAVAVNGISTLTITITNPSANTVALTGVGVTDTFPTGMVVDAAPLPTNSCSTGTFAPAAAATSISISGATIPVNTPCTFTVKVKGMTAGSLVNTTGNVTSTNGGNGTTATATLTVGDSSISGTVFYGTTPTGDPAKMVPGVALNAAGTPAASTTTALNGTYTLSALGSGAYTVTPSKPTQAPPDNNGISFQDASEVAKYVFSQRTFTANELIAADATGDGTVSLQDASEIAKRAANITSTNIVGQWKFVPTTKTYASVTGNMTGENYDGILVGDVTGNWTPPSNRPEVEAGEEQITKDEAVTEEGNTDAARSAYNEWLKGLTNLAKGSSEEERNAGAVVGGVPVSLPNTQGSASTTVLIPVTVGSLTGLNVTAYDLTVTFDPLILQPASPAFETANTLTGTATGYSVFVDPGQPAGRVRIGAFGTTPLAGAGTLIFLRFNVLAGAAAPSDLDFVNFIFGEGTPADSTTDGTFMRLGPTAASASISGRLFSPFGKGLSKTTIVLTDMQGQSRQAMTNSFGYYRFTDLLIGQAYTMEVRSKRYEFTPQVITVNGDTDNLNFSVH